MISVANNQPTGIRPNGFPVMDGKPPVDRGVEHKKSETKPPVKIPLQQWKERVGDAIDVLRQRVSFILDPHSGNLVLEPAPDMLDPKGVSDFGKVSVNNASPDGGYVKGALFHDVG